MHRAQHTSSTPRPAPGHGARRWPLSALALAALLTACGGGEEILNPIPEEARVHDTRQFTTGAAATTFTAMAAAPGDVVDMATTTRLAGVLSSGEGPANYRVEIPANWNGRLVMWAHGFRGEGPNLTVDNPPMRRHLIQQGYAWAASSYSKNFYDVRAGVEDTNALALAFNTIAAAGGRSLAAPSRIYISGFSMGGHVTGAAIDAEAAATARNKVSYQAALPMCGVMGDTELFNRFAAMQVAAQALAGRAAHPTNDWATIRADVTSALFTTFPSAPTATGLGFVSVLQNLTGGPRPMFLQGLGFGGSFPSAWGTFGSDGTVTGILNRNVLDTNAITYVIDGDPTTSAALNAGVQKLTAAPDANRLRRDGLRWIPKANGQISIPVMSLHTLGDLFVPFSMQQVYQQRVAAAGNSQRLVQRAIRGASHCDFTVAEMVEAFDDLVAWEQGGPRPAGDDVSTPATVAAPDYGCAFTRNTLGVDDNAGFVGALRAGIAQSGGLCPVAQD